MLRWRDVEGYEGIYQVSSEGDIKSLERYSLKDGRPYQFLREKILKPWRDTRGYVQVYLCKNGKSKPVGVHRIVAKAFLNNPENKKTVNHKNGDLQDNRVSNLEWATQKENNRHAWETGLMNSRKGETHPNAKLNVDKVRQIKYALSEGVAQAELSRRFKVSPSSIQQIVNGKAWRHVKI